MPELTPAFAGRLDEIIQRKPVVAAPEEDDRAFLLQRAIDRCDELFPARYAEATADHPIVTRWVSAFRTNHRRAPSLLLLGPTGVGKTYQAFGALRAAVTVELPLRWYALTTADLYASLRPRHGHDTEAQLRLYRDAELLLLDDLGAAKPSEFVEEITYRLINARYEACRPSIFTSNLSVEALKETLGDRIVSRLAEMCTRCVLTGDDRRRARPAPEGRP
jgi:DNA replication protein DnaC